MTNTSLKMEINTLPKELRDEVANFILMLKKRAKLTSGLKYREFGYAKGRIKLAKDFDKPLDEMKEYT